MQVVQGMLSIPSFGVTSAPRSERVQKAIASLASSGGIEARGAIYTKPEVVDFILDLACARYSCDLTNIRFLEPSFGGGDFLVPLIKRILCSWRFRHGESPSASDIKDSIVGFELHTETFSSTRDLISKTLIEEGFTHADSDYLSTKWLCNDDFLLANNGNELNVVVGNPQYVRHEMIPPARIREYRLRFSTFYDRADIYIPFIEKSLSSLSQSGVLGFICADRWMKNKYGGPLRKMISESFHFKIYVDMVQTQAFQEDVCAYPAISIITRDRPSITRIARNPSLRIEALKQISDLLISEERIALPGFIESTELSPSTSPWLLGGYNQVDLIRQIEADYPLLEAAGCKVGIGVATGADRVFIADYEKLDIESSRKLKLVRTRDISTGQVNWLGKGIVNPFLDNGKLVELTDFPRLERYFQRHRSRWC